MRFLKVLLWVVIAALATMLAARNWRDVTLNLWGDLQADIKIPVLMAIMLVIGLVPAWLVWRARYWRYVRRTPARPVPTPPIDERPDGAAP